VIETWICFLNYDLFQVSIVSDPSCRCGANREDSSDDDRCDCSFGELLDNEKPFGPLYIFKHVLKNNFVLFI
jgi:hypothetical protein